MRVGYPAIVRPLYLGQEFNPWSHLGAALEQMVGSHRLQPGTRGAADG